MKCYFLLSLLFSVVFSGPQVLKWKLSKSSASDQVIGMAGPNTGTWGAGPYSGTQVAGAYPASVGTGVGAGIDTPFGGVGIGGGPVVG